MRGGRQGRPLRPGRWILPARDAGSRPGEDVPGQARGFPCARCREMRFGHRAMAGKGFARRAERFVRLGWRSRSGRRIRLTRGADGEGDFARGDINGVVQGGLCNVQLCKRTCAWMDAGKGPGGVPLKYATDRVFGAILQTRVRAMYCTINKTRKYFRKYRHPA